MKITDIRESGTNNLLKWAISNGADIKNDSALHALINDQTFYLVTFSDVNFFEVFRLTQMYREKLRIINEEKAVVPPRSELAKLFPGGYAVDPEKPEEKIPLCELAEHVMSNFINLVLQMNNDDDIISAGALHLFIPMLTRKFTVQIPVGFIDFISSMKPEEADEIFNAEYPITLQKILENPMHSVQMILQMGFVKGTSIVRYNAQYDRYVKLIKYGPLTSNQSNKLYKFNLIGFHKYDPLIRGESRVDMFKPNQDAMRKAMKRMSQLNTPLELDFVIQLPIQYMQILLNCFDRDILSVAYESSMSDIIDAGLTHEDFQEPKLQEDATEEETNIYNGKIESISAYKVRISEANQMVLNSIPIIVQSQSDVDTTAAFAMLPSGYNARAVITVNMEHIQKYLVKYDATINEMLQEIVSIAEGLNNDIKNMA
ncbi:MAG: hypothetical protein NC548_46955 [Lachnospiraceae bacterium]|nr:hypothetical protein [Lachnospiraceae bacterium]